MWRSERAGSPEVLWVRESSPDSAETSFRELDDDFLQTRTRIWLGEVLHLRFDEDVGIADLLANGELLFQVSKEVWKMLLKKNGELKHSKVHIYERTSSGKSGGKYMPYPKVDSFLKICQILGLTGIDLFSPSEVVEKRDIRRVCMCIRSLSKKARSKKLNVPDFDVVTCTITMPTHLVGVIRRSLELSQYSPSNGSPWNDAREICGQKLPFGLHSQQSDSGSDEVDSIIDLEFESSLSSASYECSSSSSMCSTCNDENIEDGSNLMENNSIKENDVSKSNFKMTLNESMIHTLAPVIEEYADVAAHRLSLEERKIDKNASFSSFEDQFMLSNCNGDTEVGSKIEVAEQVDISYLSCQAQENPLEDVEGNSSKKPCVRYIFSRSDNVSENTMSKCPNGHNEKLGISSNDAMVEMPSVSGLPWMVSTVSEKQKSPEKEDIVEHTGIVPQAVLDNTLYQKETIMLDECVQNNEKGRNVGRPGNLVLKSVAGALTMVGALVIFLHVRQKKDREKNNETGVLFQIQQPNHEIFSKRQIKIGKSDSLYTREKLRF